MGGAAAAFLGRRWDMNVFADKHVAAAISRLPQSASAYIKMLLERARSNGIIALQVACEAELAKRPKPYSGDDAKRFDAMATATQDMSLVEAIRYAFGVEQLANPDEVRIIRAIAAHPGISFKDLDTEYGGPALSLSIGHLVYYRYGCFRRFHDRGTEMSRILLSVETVGGRVRYGLKPEAELVFHELKII